VRPHPPPFQDASGNVPSRADEGNIMQEGKAGISSAARTEEVSLSR